MKFVVVNTCYFGGRYYKKGEEVEFDSASDIPSHFRLIKEAESVEVAPKKETRKRVTKAKGKAKNG